MKLRKLIRLGTSLLGVRGMRSTYRPRIGPFTLNTSTQTGLSSVSVGTGPLRFKVWDRKGNTGLSSIDLPGPISYRPTQQSTQQPQQSQAKQAGVHNAPVTMNPNGLNPR